VACAGSYAAVSAGLIGFVMAVGEPSQFAVHLDVLRDAPFNWSSKVRFHEELTGTDMVTSS